MAQPFHYIDASFDGYFLGPAAMSLVDDPRFAFTVSLSSWQTARVDVDRRKNTAYDGAGTSFEYSPDSSISLESPILGDMLRVSDGIVPSSMSGTEPTVLSAAKMVSTHQVTDALPIRD
jgi:CRISPR/Cas system CMR subunit Cmr4 (Cas7 group RAMP superfamily)